jgi:hypothetical protein
LAVILASMGEDGPKCQGGAGPDSLRVEAIGVVAEAEAEAVTVAPAVVVAVRVRVAFEYLGRGERSETGKLPVSATPLPPGGMKNGTVAEFRRHLVN